MPYKLHVHNTQADIELESVILSCTLWGIKTGVVTCPACKLHVCNQAVALTIKYPNVSQVIRGSLHEKCAYKLYGYTKPQAEMLQ